MPHNKTIVDQHNNKSKFARAFTSASWGIGNIAGFASAKLGYYSDAEKTGFKNTAKEDTVNSSLISLAGTLFFCDLVGIETAGTVNNILIPIVTLGIVFDGINGFSAMKAGFHEGKRQGTPEGKNTPAPKFQ